MEKGHSYLNHEFGAYVAYVDRIGWLLRPISGLSEWLRRPPVLGIQSSFALLLLLIAASVLPPKRRCSLPRMEAIIHVHKFEVYIIYIYIYIIYTPNLGLGIAVPGREREH